MNENTYYLNDISELAEILIFDSEYELSTAVCKYKTAKELIRELLLCGYEIRAIDIETDEYGDYLDEYTVYIMDNGIVCEKLRSDDKFLWDGSSTSYFDSDVNSKFIKRFECEDCKVKFFEIKETDKTNVEDDSPADRVRDILSRNKDSVKHDDAHGFTVSRHDGDSYVSHSYYSSDPPSIDEIRLILKDFGYCRD